MNQIKHTWAQNAMFGPPCLSPIPPLHDVVAALSPADFIVVPVVVVVPVIEVCRKV
jgi:hypothetical protein